MLKCDALQPINNDKTIQLSFQGSVLAFDFGEKRVGVAHGEHLIGIAHPLTTIQAESSKDKLSAIDALVHEWQPSTLVVGLPAVHGDTKGFSFCHEVLVDRFERGGAVDFGLP